MDLANTVRGLGGIGRRPELLRLGFRDRQLTAAVREGRLVRARCGWYLSPGLPSSLTEAIRVGGRRACHTALAAAGVWLLPSTELHVHVPLNAARLRCRADRRVRLAASPRGVVIHRDDSVSVGRRRGADVDVVAALSQLASHGDDDALIVAVDSARALGLLDAGGLTRLAEVLPRRQRALLALSRDDAGSGIETLARIRLVLLGHSVRTQVELAPDIRVDLLIGDRLVIETDGKQFHDDPEAFARDRDRDLVLKAMGYRVLRLTYQQVIDDWPSVATAVTLICRRGEHFWR